MLARGERAGHLDTGMEDLVVRSIADFVDAVRTVSERRGELQWFRGQPGSDRPLVPSVFRGREPGDEVVVNARFRLHAPTRRADCPAPDDFAGWLCLMQHYGLPTRLLDWTDSPLAALFFAVSHSGTSGPASVWMLSPGVLNEAIGEPGAIMLAHEKARPLLEAAFLEPRAHDVAIAVVGQDVDLRMSLQHAAFTLHGDPTPLEERPVAERFLARIAIPAEARAGLVVDLDMLGIRRSTLFPDLESLARELAETTGRLRR